MKRWSGTLLVLVVWSAAVHADLTIVQKTTMEGGGGAMAKPGANAPTTTIRIKGNMSRTDVDSAATGPAAANSSVIIDAATSQVIVLDHNRKIAHISTPGVKPLIPPPATKGNGGRPVAMKADGIKPTGKSRTIDGLTCDEYVFTGSASLLEVGSVWEMPAVTAARERRDERVMGPDLGAAGHVDEALKDAPLVVMKGSVWISRDAPGAAEYREYQKALASAQLPSAAMPASGLTMSGFDKLVKAIDGLPVLAVIGWSIDYRGQPTDITERVRDPKMTTKVESIKTDAIGDDVFKVPADYQIIK